MDQRNTTQAELVTVRALATRDSLVLLTELLNRTYAALHQRGLNFTAATQDVDTTRRRCADGQCFVAEVGGAVVGTVTAGGPYGEDQLVDSVPGPWYRDPDGAHFQQFGVDPAHQRLGIGRKLVAACEQWARERGFASIALDTAEPATELTAMYQRLGYTPVGFMQWPGKTYRSVVLRKWLQHSALRSQLQTLARYNAWATRRLCAALQPVPDEAYRRPVGLFFNSLHGTLNHLLLADQALWFPRFTGGTPTATALDTEVEPDRTQLAQRLQEGAARWQPWLEAVSERQLQGDLHYRSTAGRALTLPFAATLTHVFNHATHHRGQVTAALTQLGQPCPVLDLVAMLVEEKDAA